MRRTTNLILCLLLAQLLLGGCACFKSYTHVARANQASIQVGNYNQALADFPEKKARGKNALLFRLERALLLQYSGNFEDSLRQFEKVDKLLRKTEDGPVISTSALAAKSSSLLINEQTKSYKGDDFERVLINAFNALNYLMLGELDDSRVEVRKSYAVQARLAEQHSKLIAKASDHQYPTGVNNQLDSGPFMLAKTKSASVISVYQNAFAYYLSALIYELGGEPNDAYIDLKKAFNSCPNCKPIQRDLIRLSKQLGFKEEQLAWEKRFGAVKPPEKDAVDVCVIFITGVSPVKIPFNITYPDLLGTTPDAQFVLASIPTYEYVPSMIRGYSIEYADSFDYSSTILDVDAVASRNLLDEMPILLSKQLSRSLLKALLTVQLALASDHFLDDNGHSGAYLGMLLSSYSEVADLRSWSSLPKQIDIARFYVPKGVSDFTVRPTRYGKPTTITIPASASNMVVYCRVSETSLNAYYQAFKKGSLP